MSPRWREGIIWGTVAVVGATSLLAGCGTDEEPQAAGPTTVAASPSLSATATSPSLTLSPTPVPSAPANATTPAPSPKPTPTVVDDENGELAGQVIIEYPGKPLRRSSSTTPNSDVSDLQVRLNEVGYPVKVTGLFNAETERAVIRFQRDDGLKVDGIVGPATWAALFTFEGGAG